MCPRTRSAWIRAEKSLPVCLTPRMVGRPIAHVIETGPGHQTEAKINTGELWIKTGPWLPSERLSLPRQLRIPQRYEASRKSIREKTPMVCLPPRRIDDDLRADAQVEG